MMRSVNEGRDEIFISYSGGDRAWAEWIGQVLESAGLSVRMQAWDVAAGANFVEWIGQQLQNARRTIALYSKSYFSSYWCTQEWTSALADRSLIPIRIEDVIPPPPLNTQNYVDLFNADEKVAQQRLLEAVNLLPIKRRAAGGFPGEIVSKTDSPAIPRAQESRTTKTGRQMGQWLDDLTDLDKARDLIDESLRIEFQRRILSRRFDDYDE
jgi:hypothetical protein